MKKLFLFIMVLAIAVSLYAINVTDNPSGANYPIHLKRSAKATPVTFSIKTWAIFDTSTAATNKLAVDVDTLSAKEYLWIAPFDCKVDSFFFAFGSAETLFNVDTAAAAYHWRVRIISDTCLGGGKDTIRFDSTVSASIGNNKRKFGKWKPRGGPDSTLRYLEKGDYLMFQLNHVAGCSSRATFNGNFTVTPADW